MHIAYKQNELHVGTLFLSCQPFKHFQSTVSCLELDSKVFGNYLPTVSMIQPEDSMSVATHSCKIFLKKYGMTQRVA